MVGELLRECAIKQIVVVGFVMELGAGWSPFGTVAMSEMAPCMKLVAEELERKIAAGNIEMEHVKNYDA